METIKICTDLSQSKVLTEILPLESADMVLLHEEPYETSDSKFDGLHQALCVPFNKYDKSWRQKYKNISYFPCWSLAALHGILTENKICHYNERYYCQYIREGDEFPIYSTAAYNNPIDACYEMILKLHELNLL